MTYVPEVDISFKNSELLDAFGRQRVSEPETIFDSKQIFDNQPLVWDDQEVSGSGTSSTYSQNAARTRLATTAATAGKRVRQTFMRFNYEPGKSQLIFITGRLRSDQVDQTGLTGGIGYFDDQNGLFFKCEEGAVKVVQRSYVSGSAVDTEVDQADWNLDKFDGTGKSKKTLVADNTQIFVIDATWLGVGPTRFGIQISNIDYWCHQFENANIRNSVYMSTPNLPIRYEIENDGTSVTGGQLDHICASVISEGGTNDNGVLRYDSTAENFINTNTVGTIYAIMGIRLKTSALGATVKFVSQSMMNAQNGDYEWLLILNPTLANAITFTAQTNSVVETGPGNSGSPSNSTVTGGTVLAGGVVKGSNSTGDVTIGVENALLLGSDISGTRDEIYLCCRPFSANADIHGGLVWRELS